MPNYISKDEIGLYPAMVDWLDAYLKAKYPKAETKAYDVHSVNLSNFIFHNKLKKYFSDYATYEIKVDLIGVIINKDKCDLVFVEVKDTKISLKDLSQLLGYCKVFDPKEAFMLSPKGIGSPVKKLLLDFNRLDILEYSKGNSIKVASWLPERKNIDYSTLLSF